MALLKEADFSKNGAKNIELVQVTSVPRFNGKHDFLVLYLGDLMKEVIGSLQIDCSPARFTFPLKEGNL